MPREAWPLTMDRAAHSEQVQRASVLRQEWSEHPRAMNKEAFPVNSEHPPIHTPVHNEYVH
eukprot:12694190-Alexandrium_andersonii.AAC.1